MHECETDTDLHQLGFRELGTQCCLLISSRGTRLVEERVGEDQRTLVPFGQTAVRPLIRDLLDEILGEPFLPRDREAQLLSKAAVGDGGIAEPSDFLGGLFHQAVAPEVTVQVTVRRGREILGDRIDRLALGISQAR